MGKAIWIKRVIVCFVILITIIYGAFTSYSLGPVIADEDNINAFSIEQIPAKGNPKLDSMLNVLSSGNDPQTLSLSGLEGFMQTEDTVRVIIEVVSACVESVISNSYLLRMVESSYSYKTDVNLTSIKNIINSDTTFINDINKLSPSSGEWSQVYGGSGEDYGFSINQTSDGGYIIVGQTSSYGAGNLDVWLIKTDPDGNEEWNKTFGRGEADYGRDVQQTTDNGYIITGFTESYGSNRDIWLIKTDANGNKEWSRTFGGNGPDYGYSVCQTSDGGYIITGSTTSYGAGNDDFWLIKTDTNGNEEWNKTFGGSEKDIGKSVCQTTDDGYVLTGYTYSYGSGYCDVWLIKTDASGNEEWDKTFGGSDYDWGYSVCQTSDSGYVITGRRTINTLDDVWLIKTDASGNEKWNNTYSASGWDVGYSVCQALDGGYIVAGYTSSGGGVHDGWLIKTDSNGNEEWNKTFGGNDYENFYSVCQTSDGNYIAAGYTKSYGSGAEDVLVYKYYDTIDNTLTMAVNGNGTVTPGVGSYRYPVNSTVNVTATPSANWEFTNWTGDVAEPNLPNTSVTLDTDKTIIANFHRINSMLTIKTIGSGNTTPPVGSHFYPIGTAVDITATPVLGWIFQNWTGDVADVNSASTTVSMETDKIVTANFLCINGTLTMNIKGAGYTSPAVGNHMYPVGTTVNITATPVSGWIFQYWTGDVADVNSANTTVTINNDKMVTANFIKEKSILTMVVYGSGNVTPSVGSHTYSVGTTVNITAIPTSGWRFVNWTGDVGNTNSDNTTVIMDEDKTVIANFNPLTTQTWYMTFGGKNDDAGRSAQQTLDGGYITFINIDGLPSILKTDRYGREEWSKSYANSDYIAESGIQTSDGNYIIVCRKSLDKTWIIKIDANGNELWNVTFNGYSWSVCEAPDGGYVLSGGISNDVKLTKIGSDGSQDWSRTYSRGSQYQCMGNSVIRTMDNGYIIAVESMKRSDLDRDGWLIKTDTNGNMIWNKLFSSEKDEQFNSVYQTSDGGYIIAGESKNGSAGGYDIWLLKTDSNGNEEWSRIFGGIESEKGNSVYQSSDGGYCIAGGTSSFGNRDMDLWLIRTNTEGDIEWEGLYGGNRNDCAKSVTQTDDGGLIVSGWTESYGAGGYDVWLLKLATNSKTLNLLTSGNGTTIPSAGGYPYSEDTTVNITATPASGWQFDGWMGDVADGNLTTTDVTMNSDKTITAEFSKVSGLPSGGGGGGGGAPKSNPGVTDVREYITSTGKFRNMVIASSNNSLVKFIIDKDTIGKQENGRPLRNVSILEKDNPPTASDNKYMIGLVYDLGPDGATFEPSATLIFTYNQQELPEEVKEGDLAIAVYYEESGSWEILDSIVNPDDNTVTAEIEHFTAFAIITDIPATSAEHDTSISLAPATFNISNLSISHAEIDIGQTVTISVMVANTGDLIGSHVTTLKINGTSVATEKVTLSGGKSHEVIFTITAENADKNIVEVGELIGGFIVNGEEEPSAQIPLPLDETGTISKETQESPLASTINWWIISGSIIALIAIAMIGLYFTWWRKRNIMT